MGSELVRFGVAMDNDLLDRFDALIARRGYATRSEALRDLVRGALVEAHLEADGPAVATALLDLLHRGIDGGSLGGLRVALATPFSSEQDVTLTMLK
jgi:Arc/MetJ-type ribon-helix-helix transcriptional regulator